MPTLFRTIDTLSEWCGRLAIAMLVVLVVAMVGEVFMRYAVNRPSLWAFDLSYMLNGGLFYVGAGYAMKHHAHVRIDFLSSRLPQVWQARIVGAALAFVFAPILAIVSWIAVRKAFAAFVTGAVEEVSPWAPLVWPFYAAIALGLVVFTLQSFVEGIRFLASGRVSHELVPTEI
jgi:TRAP-type mannitol/chloroaromatic compound transport system permease small subunit